MYYFLALPIVEAGFDHYHSAFTPWVSNLRLKHFWLDQLTVFTTHSGVLSYLSAMMPSHYIQVVLPGRGHVGGICHLIVAPVFGCVWKPSVSFFLNTGWDDYRVGCPSPVPRLCPLQSQSGSLVHFSLSWQRPRWHHHTEVLNVVTFLCASSTIFHSLNHCSLGPDTDAFCFYFCKRLLCMV